MLHRISRKLPVAGFILMMATCAGQIVRSAFAAPVTAPVAKDVDKAGRQAASRVGGPDAREPLPESNDLVGGNGVVEPAQRETRVAAQVSAVVEKILVHEGDRVKAGDVLVQLANGVETAALQAAEADAAAEQANLNRALKGVRLEDRDAIASDAAAAKARADLSASVAARTEQLAKTGAATPDELERARRTAQSDLANYLGAQARQRAADAGSRAEDIAFARARLLAAQARAAQAKATLERLTIRAPSDGEVLQLKLREGELYSFQGSEPLVVMGDTRTLRVRMDVDERDIARVREGAEAFVVADAFGATKFPGRVVEIGRRFGRKNIRTDDPVERNDTKILEVVIELQTHAQLVPGQRVKSFITGTSPQS